MQDLLTNPAVQAAGAPFVVALVLSLVLRRFLPAMSGLAVVGGFLLAVALTTGLTLMPFTSTRKIVICSFALPFVALLLEMLSVMPRFKYVARTLPALMLAVAILWIIWPVVQRQEGMTTWLMAAPVMLYVAVVIACMGVLGRMQGNFSQVFNAQAGSLLVLAMSSGVVTLIAASALYSQLAFAVFAAVGAMVVVSLVTAPSEKSVGLGMLTLYAAAIPVTLIAAAATIYAQLSLLVLLFLALVPLFAGLPLPKPQQRWLGLIVTCLWASIPTLPAIWLAWRAAGPVSF